MRVLSPAWIVVLVLCVAPAAWAQDRADTVLVFRGANSHETYFTMHNIRAAHAITKGKGAKIGILDHSFGFDVHPGLYAGGQPFQADDWAQTFHERSHHGYWMALVAHEIAPEAEIYALGTSPTTVEGGERQAGPTRRTARCVWCAPCTGDRDRPASRRAPLPRRACDSRRRRRALRE